MHGGRPWARRGHSRLVSCGGFVVIKPMILAKNDGNEGSPNENEEEAEQDEAGRSLPDDVQQPVVRQSTAKTAAR